MNPSICKHVEHMANIIIFCSVLKVFFTLRHLTKLVFIYNTTTNNNVGGVGSVVECRSLADVLSLSCARPAADG